LRPTAGTSSFFYSSRGRSPIDVLATWRPPTQEVENVLDVPFESREGVHDLGGKTDASDMEGSLTEGALLSNDPLQLLFSIPDAPSPCSVRSESGSSEASAAFALSSQLERCFADQDVGAVAELLSPPYLACRSDNAISHLHCEEEDEDLSSDGAHELRFSTVHIPGLFDDSKSVAASDMSSTLSLGSYDGMSESIIPTLSLERLGFGALQERSTQLVDMAELEPGAPTVRGMAIRSYHASAQTPEEERAGESEGLTLVMTRFSRLLNFTSSFYNVGQFRGAMRGLPINTC
jgi:hypothetical protein